MKFEFATATKIIFGAGSANELANEALHLGSKALVLTGSSPMRWSRLCDLLSSRSIRITSAVVSGEPTVAMIHNLLATAQAEKCDMVISIGGGSVIDAGKAVTGLLGNGGDITDYVEVIGKGKVLDKPAAPFIALPTTAGTGAEVTKNAVISIPDKKVKVSLRSPHLLPKVAIVDPLLTISLPGKTTAETGLDALTQCIEAFTSCKSNPVSDALSRTGIQRAARSLLRACSNRHDLDAREDMSLAGLLSGLALANSGLGAVHGFAAVIGGHFEMHHGAICAQLLPHVVAANIKGSENHPSTIKFSELACLLTGKSDASPLDTVRWLGDLYHHLGIFLETSLSIEQKYHAEIIAAAKNASSMKGNPVPLSDEELSGILKQAFGE